jgi:hypothetical protein
VNAHEANTNQQDSQRRPCIMLLSDDVTLIPTDLNPNHFAGPDDADEEKDDFAEEDDFEDDDWEDDFDDDEDDDEVEWDDDDLDDLDDADEEDA